VTSLPWL